MTKDHYSFVGCTCALEYYINASNSSDKQEALDACAQLVSVRENIMQECAGDSSEEKAREVFGQHVVTVLESVERLRGTTLFSELDSTLVDLLDHFYNTADSIMGGGGECGFGWPHSSGCGSSFWGSGSGSGSFW